MAEGCVTLGSVETHYFFLYWINNFNLEVLNLLTYMRVLDFAKKTPPSQDGCIDHCNVGFP